MGEGGGCVSGTVDRDRGDQGLEMTIGAVDGQVHSSRSGIAVEQAYGLEFEVDDADSAPRYPSGNSTVFGAVANFSNTIVGAGIVGLPYAISQSGLWAGIFMMVLAAYLTRYSAIMLIVTGEKAKRLNYEELMGEVFGSAGFHLFNFFVGVISIGAGAAYLIIVGDTVTMIARASGAPETFSDRQSVITLFAVLIALPLACLKDLSKLSYTSFISILSDILLIIIIISTGGVESRDYDDIDRSQTFVFIRPRIFAGFGAISFAFVCQSSSFLVYRSLRKKTMERWRRVATWATLLAFFMGLFCALAGYLSFVNQTEGNILNNFSPTHEGANVARGLLAVTMVLTFPMDIYVGRHLLDASIFQTLLGMGPITSARHYLVTIVLWFLCLALALSTEDLGDILEIFGAFGASMVGYVMPAMLFIQCHRGELRRSMAAWRKGEPEYQTSFVARMQAMRKFFLPFFMVVFGLVAMVAGVATAVVSELHPTRT